MFSLQERFVQISSNTLRYINYMISLPGFRILVFEKPEGSGGHKPSSILDKYKISYELWDIKDDKILSAGKFDTYGVNYLCDFSYYTLDFVCILRSVNAERSILLFDFVTGQKKFFKKSLPYESFQLADNETKVELIAFPDTGIIVLFEKMYMNDAYKIKTPSGSRKTSEDIQPQGALSNENPLSNAAKTDVSIEEGKYILYVFTVFQENINEPLNRIKIRRDKPRFRKESIAMRANLSNTIVFCDYCLGEVMVWNIFKPQDSVRYFNLFLSDFKIMKAIAFEDNALLIVKEKNHKLIQIMDISLKEDKCLITNLINERILGTSVNDFGGIHKNKAIFFRKSERNYILLISCYKNKPDNVYFNLFENRTNTHSTTEKHFHVILSQQKTIENFPTFRQNDFNDYVICFSKTEKNEKGAKTLKMKLMYLENFLLERLEPRHQLERKLKLFILLHFKNNEKHTKLNKLILERVFSFLFEKIEC